MTPIREMNALMHARDKKRHKNLKPGQWREINMCNESETQINLIDKSAPNTEAWGSQKDGTHYKIMPIQPMEYSMANKFDALQHTAIKYISRFRDKNGIADLEKAKHCIQMLIDWEQKYGNK